MGLPTIIIRRCPTDSFSYFQWFLLGLYQLEDQKKIKIKFKINLLDRICLFWTNNKFIAGLLRRGFHLLRNVPRYNLLGEIIYENKRKKFSIDSKDSPFVYTVKDLKQCDAYFKLQCPIEFNKLGFEIIPNKFLPWQDVTFEHNKNKLFARKRSDEIYDSRFKIFPGMIGPRRLGWSCKKNTLYKNYKRFLDSYSPKNRKLLTAYFGSANFPSPSSKKLYYDLDWESDLMAYLNNEGNHPNEKRGKAVHIINSLDSSQYEGRLIKETTGKTNSDLIIPLTEFCKYLSEYSYNLNISGFRLSIPNRFIESFMVGTAIITDKLHVKWFQSFGDEVIETIEMGYRKLTEKDWHQFEKDLKVLPTVSSENIRKKFFEKWAPANFAEYIINTTIQL